MQLLLQELGFKGLRRYPGGKDCMGSTLAWTDEVLNDRFKAAEVAFNVRYDEIKRVQKHLQFLVLKGRDWRVYAGEPDIKSYLVEHSKEATPPAA